MRVYSMPLAAVFEDMFRRVPSVRKLERLTGYRPETSVETIVRRVTDHEWARIKGKVAVVGVTQFAQEQLGDVVFVELPKIGAKVEAGKPFGEAFAGIGLM